MKLAKVRIQDFRAIAAMELELDPHLTVLVGENAAGKTSVLAAIAMGLGSIVARAPGGRQGSNRRDIRRTNGVTATHAAVLSTTMEGVFWRVVARRDNTEQTREAAGLPAQRRAPEGLYGLLDPAIHARSAGIGGPPLPVVAYYGTDRSAVRGLKQYEYSSSTSGNDAFDCYKNALNPNATFSALFNWFDEAESEELRHRRDTDPTWTSPQLAAVRKAVETVIPNATNLRVTADRALQVTLREPDGHEEELDLNELSGGYRTLLALVADLARRMAQANPTLGTNSEAIVLIDEVDLHLHPKWQQTVLDDLRRAFPNAQFIVTTHSEQVIAAVQPHQIVQLERHPELGVAASSPSSTYGATPDRVSRAVMGVPHLRRADVEEKLAAYWSLIHAGQGESEEARGLRATLDGWFRGEDPEMVRADAEIQRQKMLARIRGGTP